MINDNNGGYGLLVSPKGPGRGPILQHGVMTLDSCMGQLLFPGYPPAIKHGPRKVRHDSPIQISHMFAIAII